MYFPFLRGKKYELQTISELTALIVETSRVTPIIEPVNLNAFTRRIIPEINQARVPFVFIINPQVGDLTEEEPEVFQSLLNATMNRQLITLGYVITESTTIDDIHSTMNTFADYHFAFIHTTNSRIRDEIAGINERVRFHIFMDSRVSSAYQNAFNDKARILVKDCFNAQARNADYDDDEYFAELFSTYESNDYFGFGDFQIVGAGISGGGPAHAVALHFTYLKDLGGQEIWVKHFISDDTETPANVQGKYFQALRKLVNFLNVYINTPETVGAGEYRRNHMDGAFHGLGYPKKLSMKHHIELMTHLL